MRISKKVKGKIFLGVMFLTVGILMLLGYSITDWYIWLIGVGLGLTTVGIINVIQKEKRTGGLFSGVFLFVTGVGYSLGWGLTAVYLGLGLAFIIHALAKLYVEANKEEKRLGIFIQ